MSESLREGVGLAIVKAFSDDYERCGSDFDPDTCHRAADRGDVVPAADVLADLDRTIDERTGTKDDVAVRETRFEKTWVCGVNGDACIGPDCPYAFRHEVVYQQDDFAPSHRCATDGCSRYAVACLNHVQEAHAAGRAEGEWADRNRIIGIIERHRDYFDAMHHVNVFAEAEVVQDGVIAAFSDLISEIRGDIEGEAEAEA